MRYDLVEFSVSCKETGIDAKNSDVQDKCIYPTGSSDGGMLKSTLRNDAVFRITVFSRIGV